MKKFMYLILSLLLAGILIFFLYSHFKSSAHEQKTIKVGILHSLTGALAASEKPIVDATLLALDEINKNGGLLGKKLEAVVADTQSNPHTFATQAEHLIVTEKVAVIFGGLTSASRKTMLPVIEKYNSLLFYPVQYEGLELSPNIVYTGSVPNQQILPGVRWSFNNLGKRFFLVGSDSIYPRTVNKLIREFVKSIGGEVAGEEYLLLGSKDVKSIIQKITETKPTVILNSIVGETNGSFFSALRQAGIASEKIPTMSFSVAETEIYSFSLHMVGDYACRSYFQSINNEENKKFIEKFKKKYGEKRLISDSLEAAYFGVHLWAQAVTNAKSVATDEVRSKLTNPIYNQAYNAPEGIVYIDPKTQHTWKFIRIGKIQDNGQFNILWESRKAIRPLPYPTMFGAKETWDQFINSLYTQWGNQWAKPIS